jgi:uncharacterized protein (TIGR02246 family)
MRRSLQVFVLAASLSVLAGCSGEAPPAVQVTAAADMQGVRSFLDHVQTSFNGGNFEEFMNVFTDDAIQLNAGLPDTVGKAAIRQGYEAALAANDIKVEFHTDEIEVAGDLAYERGTYSLRITPKADGAKAIEVTNRHIHILRRQADGSWKTWRMMTNSGAPPPQ